MSTAHHCTPSDTSRFDGLSSNDNKTLTESEQREGCDAQSFTSLACSAQIGRLTSELPTSPLCA